MPRENEVEFVSWALKGYRPAIDYCNIVFRTSQLYDDFIDGDKHISKAQVHQMMWDVFVDMTANSFFQQNIYELNPLIRQYLLDYSASVRLEGKGDAHSLSISFILRDSVSSLLEQCAYLVGGKEWLDAVSSKIREHIFEEEYSC